jgi:hypothetical protein
LNMRVIFIHIRMHIIHAQWQYSFEYLVSDISCIFQPVTICLHLILLRVLVQLYYHQTCLSSLLTALPVCC